MHKGQVKDYNAHFLNPSTYSFDSDFWFLTIISFLSEKLNAKTPSKANEASAKAQILF